MIATGKAEGGTGIFIVHTVPFPSFDGCGAADLFNEAPYQSESMPLTFGLGLETMAIVADGHSYQTKKRPDVCRSGHLAG
jgi:hypothetical protein